MSKTRQFQLHLLMTEGEPPLIYGLEEGTNNAVNLTNYLKAFLSPEPDKAPPDKEVAKP